MTIDDKIQIVSGVYGASVPVPGATTPPPEAHGGDGFVPVFRGSVLPIRIRSAPASA